MFAGVARRYDVLNHVLSMRRDVAWRRRLVRALRLAPEGPVLDLATGTGDVVLAADRAVRVGSDFCLDMLLIGRGKAQRRGVPVRWAVADALALPFAPGSFAAVTVAFGVRNFADLGTGLAEMRRVLAPGGIVGILEFQRPRRRLVAGFMRLWNRLVVVPAGRLLSDDRDAYSYLPASVESFADAGELAGAMAAAGFDLLESRELSAGIVALTVARRREDE